MEETKLAEIMELKEKPLEDLKAKYVELFSQEPTSNNNDRYCDQYSCRIG